MVTMLIFLLGFPWFVSDVTVRDFHWTLEIMKNDPDNGALRDLAEKCLFYLNTQQFAVEENFYYCTPLPYHIIEKEDPNLYRKLTRSKLLIFKGDLNYRKLGTDLNWPKTISFINFDIKVNSFEISKVIFPNVIIIFSKFVIRDKKSIL